MKKEMGEVGEVSILGLLDYWIRMGYYFSCNRM